MMMRNIDEQLFATYNDVAFHRKVDWSIAEEEEPATSDVDHPKAAVMMAIGSREAKQAVTSC